MTTRTSTLGLASWAFYDWAHSAFPTIVQTFIFAAYFTRAVAADEIQGSSQWGMAIGSAGIAIALAAPLLGAIADQSGRRKPWLFCFTWICAAGTACLWFVQPKPDHAIPALMVVAIATVAAECAFVFYNAMLPALAPPDRLGRWSGWGWGLGYCGGLTCLAVALFVLDVGKGGDATRSSFPLAAAWLVVFSLPLFLFTPDAGGDRKPIRVAARAGFIQLVETLRHVRRYRTVMRFLIAHLFYIDGLATLFAFGGVYAAGTFGMTEREVLMFGITLNLSAGIGAIAFSWLDDAIGSRRTILWSLVGLIVMATTALVVESATMFWVAGSVLGIFVGPAQAASRSYLAHVSPPTMRTEMFGLYEMAGKATAFMGPLLVASVTHLSQSQRGGMYVVVGLMVVGFVIMLGTPEAKGVPEEADESLK